MKTCHNRAGRRRVEPPDARLDEPPPPAERGGDGQLLAAAKGIREREADDAAAQMRRLKLYAAHNYAVLGAVPGVGGAPDCLVVHNP